MRITTSTICGTDLHILKGDVPSVTDGRILGHEGVGIVEDVGSGVSSFRKDDKVLISCITSCGKCDFCKKGMYSHCRSGGWILGNTIDGTQAEYVRIPHRGQQPPPPPAGRRRGGDGHAERHPSRPASSAASSTGRSSPATPSPSWGPGPVGLAALLTAQFYSPAEIVMIDLDENRLQVARSLGATKEFSSADGKAVQKIMDLTGGAGVDVAIEAVGIPATFDICQDIVAPGGRVANVGVHGKPVTLHLERLWARNITLTTRLVDTVTTPMLLKVVASGRLQPKKLVTHRFALSDVMKAYDTFGDAAKERALKVILQRSER